MGVGENREADVLQSKTEHENSDEKLTLAMTYVVAAANLQVCKVYL